jgi:hypothetical protein
MEIPVFWDVASCSSIETYRHLGVLNASFIRGIKLLTSSVSFTFHHGMVCLLFSNRGLLPGWRVVAGMLHMLLKTADKGGGG